MAKILLIETATDVCSAAIAVDGAVVALAEDPHLANGLNVAAGQVTCRPVAEAQRHPYVEASRLVA